MLSERVNVEVGLVHQEVDKVLPVFFDGGNYNGSNNYIFKLVTFSVNGDLSNGLFLKIKQAGIFDSLI